jgi:hypothetical protein
MFSVRTVYVLSSSYEADFVKPLIKFFVQWVPGGWPILPEQA